jgi:hypothetical protein
MIVKSQEAYDNGPQKRRRTPLFAEMLSLPNDGRYPALDSAPQQRSQRTLEALTTQVARLASQKPVLMRARRRD